MHDGIVHSQRNEAVMDKANSGLSTTQLNKQFSKPMSYYKNVDNPCQPETNLNKLEA